MPKFRVEVDGITMVRCSRRELAAIDHEWRELEVDHRMIRYWQMNMDRHVFEGEAPQSFITRLMALAQGHRLP